MSEWGHSIGSGDRLRIQAWTYSLALHTVIIGLMIVVGRHIALAPQEDVFRWNVAMIEPAASPEPMNPAPPQPSPPADSPADATPQKSPTKPVVAHAEKPMPIERRIETALQPVVQHVETKSQEPLIERDVRTVEAAPRLERTPDNRPSAVETPQITAPHAETAPTVMERPAQIAESHPAPMERSVDASHVEPEVVHRSEASQRATSTPVEQARPIATESTNFQPVEQVARPVHDPIETAPAIPPHEMPSSPPHPAESTAMEKQVAQEEKTLVAKAAPAATPTARADYGWVRDALWRRIVEMKHYPSQARLNHLEGKVILRAVIKADGQLADLMVKESSGHRILDDAAMEVIRRICPVPMKHALGKPEIVVMIPIDYRLE